ncbi:MAG: 16S rRNA (uracil(1498)-N(3))-methyltransferase [Liquorilactobacillus satsumensis]|uniref:16S rRNA (uracil(1498)-N(3))-methyltransferase n=1 Tax=Liquorilactobacillus satsumensis TaxID=259059 RepID=UPI0039EA3C94
MQRYFVKQADLPELFGLPSEIYQHAIVVMRMKKGDCFEVVTTQKQVLLVELVEVTAQTAKVRVLKRFEHQVELPVRVTLACGLPKKDKAEWIVQKGTELGAANFIFFGGEYSVAKWDSKKQPQKVARLQKIAQNAAEQAHRVVTPQVTFAPRLNKIAFNEFDYKVTAYEEAAKQGEKTVLKRLFEALQAAEKGKQKSLIAVFGPEGGLSAAEISDLRAQAFELAGLGPRIMRAETAPLYLLAALSFVLELG